MTLHPHPSGPGPFPPIPLASIATDAACQTRAKIRPGVVRDYARAIAQQSGEGALRFPPVVLFTDGTRYWLGDGVHRVLAARAAGLAEFPADVRPGTERDALLFALSANAHHGLPRTNSDKRRVVALLLADAEWGRWSDREIARRCRVSQSFVTRLRRGASDAQHQMRPRKVRRGDTVYEMEARANRGQPAAPDPAAPAHDPEAATAPANDGVGLPLPADARPAFAARAVFDAAAKLSGQLADLVDQLARSPGGAAYLPHLVPRREDGQVTFRSPELNVFAQKLRAAAPHCGSCPRCQARYAGRGHPACKLCGGRGWLSKGEYEVCPDAERRELLRLRGPERFHPPVPHVPASQTVADAPGASAAPGP